MPVAQHPKCSTPLAPSSLVVCGGTGGPGPRVPSWQDSPTLNEEHQFGYRDVRSLSPNT